MRLFTYVRKGFYFHSRVWVSIRVSCPYRQKTMEEPLEFLNYKTKLNKLTVFKTVFTWVGVLWVSFVSLK